MGVRLHFYELRGHPDLAALAADTSFENVRDPQFTSDFAKVSRWAGNVIRDTRARDHFQIGEFCECGQDVLLHALGKKCILLVAAKIREGEDGNAFFRSDRGGWNYDRRRSRWAF